MVNRFSNVILLNGLTTTQKIGGRNGHPEIQTRATADWAIELQKIEGRREERGARGMGERSEGKRKWGEEETRRKERRGWVERHDIERELKLREQQMCRLDRI